MDEERTYRIGEVAALLNLNTSALRYWEDEFPQIASIRTGKGQRRYTENHIALLRQIQVLLYEKGMTIEGARKILDNEKGKNIDKTPDSSFINMLERELVAIQKLLSARMGQ